MFIRPSRSGIEITHHKLRQLIEVWGKSTGLNSMHGFNLRQGTVLHAYLQGASNSLDFATGLDESNAALHRQLIEVLGMIKENYQVIIDTEDK